MFLSLEIVVDAALEYFAKFGAHLLEELAVNVVIQIGECDLFGRHGTNPILVILLIMITFFRLVNQHAT